MSHLNDLVGMLKGLKTVLEAVVKIQDAQAKFVWKNSSLKPLLEQAIKPSTSKTFVGSDISFKEGAEKFNVILTGIRNYISLNIPAINTTPNSSFNELKSRAEIEELNREFNKTFQNLESIQRQNLATFEEKQNLKIDHNIESRPEQGTTKLQNKAAPNKTVQSSIEQINSNPQNKTGPLIKPIDAQPRPKQPIVAKPRTKQSLSDKSKQRVVPSSRISRMISFGSLAAGLGVGTIAQYARNTIQTVTGTEEKSVASVFFSTANAERIVDTLCKVRGAALKLGQLLSLQDENVISPELQKVFERVRQSADFMPKWQVEKVIVSQLGSNWRDKLQSFDDKPFAAASIGQVHLAKLHDGTEVAMKIQYPGVAKGINSDIDNLMSVLKVWDVFPKGMFIDNLVEVAKKELSWEVDYVREAECTKKFKEILAPYPEYYVPRIIDELSTAEVISSELIDGIPLDKCFEMDGETKHHIASLIMKLCLREMFVLRCMQTDPNWANFFYDPNTKKVILLDFGATRVYSKEFMDQYIQIIKAASVGDRTTVLKISKDIKFLTGYESKLMENTHVDTVMILGEVFSTGKSGFNFGSQDMTKRIQHLIPTILNHRLCPPPEEIYSLHRKLSGVFLLCYKLNVKINCRDMFNEIYDDYKFDNK